MNERIKELAIKSGIISAESNGFDPTGLTKAQQRFADLIVQECADFAYTQSIYSRGVPWNQVIKKHFDMTITNDDLAPYFRSPPDL